MNENVIASLQMLNAFASVGSRRFDVTQIDLRKRKTYWRSGLNVAAMEHMLPHFVPRAWEFCQNLIVRPSGAAGSVLAQLDDLKLPGLDLVRQRAFLTLETSPDNYQAWLSIVDGDDDLIRRLVKGLGVDWNASRAVRLAGTPNCKPRYAPNFPVVRIIDIQSGRKVWPKELELDLAPPRTHRSFLHCSVNRGWPDHAYCLKNAPLKSDGTPDASQSDFMWAKWALERGNSFDAVVAKLLEVSAKARQEWDRGNKDYVRRTVEAAEKAAKIN